MSLDKEGRKDIGSCDGCGTAEHLELLDGKLNSDGEHESTLCIACYGEGWDPCGASSFDKSIEPRFATLYANYRKAHPDDYPHEDRA